MLESLVVWYLFLGGAGAGVLFVTAILECLSPHVVKTSRTDWLAWYKPKDVYSRFFAPAYGVGFFAVVLGMICLLFDLGRSDRILAIFLQPTLSFISVGTFALVALLVAAAVMVAVWAFGRDRVPQIAMWVVRIFTIGISFVVMAYTGLLLSSMPGVPLWVSPWIPPLFVVSALSSGIALLICAVLLTGSDGDFKSTLGRLQKIDAALIAGEFALLLLFVGGAYAGHEFAWVAARRLFIGDLAAPFLGFVVILGLLVPFVGEVGSKNPSARSSVVMGILVLVGGFFLRWCIAEAGVVPNIALSAVPALGI